MSKRPASTSRAHNSKKKRVQTVNPLEGLSLEDFNLSLGRDVPESHVHLDHISSDLRRVHKRSVPTRPVSPIKAPPQSRDNTFPDDADDVDVPVDDDLGQGDDEGEWEDVEEDPVAKTARKRATAKRYVNSDYPMREWLKRRDEALAVLMSIKGRLTAPDASCAHCKKSEGLYRCRDCFSMELLCQDCCVRAHSSKPLDRIEKWTGLFFLRVSLQSLGLWVQMGHEDGSACPNPIFGSSKFTVVHINGIHQVSVAFCSCAAGVRHEPWTQLMRKEWYPATLMQPQTAFTFRVLETFQLMNFEGKITAYHFYRSLERITDNTGCLHVPKRYSTFLRIVRQWRHLRALKRGGRGNDAERRVSETHDGELAVKCIACPIPGVNLPPDWQDAPPERKFIYTLFIAMDACFRLKRKVISSWQEDPSLQDGFSYFVKYGPYKEFYDTLGDQDEMSTCSGLSAVDHANTKFSKGYSVTGVGCGTCGRHEVVFPNGVGDVQKGEKYGNIDYIVCSFLLHVSALLILLFSYDICCQWSKRLRERLLLLPPLVRLNLVLRVIKFVIPKLHILGHLRKCQELFSLLFTSGVGVSDMEGIERIWSALGLIGGSTKEMGPGSRQETIEDHIGDWNWSKIIGLGILLRDRLKRMLKELPEQREALEIFTTNQLSDAAQWKQSVEDFEAGHSDFNPYALPDSGPSLQDVRLELLKEEQAKERNSGTAAAEDTDEEDPNVNQSPTQYLFMLVELEDTQRQLQQDIRDKRSPTSKEQGDFVTRSTRLQRGINRLRAVQAIHSPGALQYLASHPSDPTKPPPPPESIPLLPPSSLPASARTVPFCADGLVELERRIRDAQCRKSLAELRHNLICKRRLLTHKAQHARHQGANTRSRVLLHKQQLKIELSRDSYRHAWQAKLHLCGDDPRAVGWQKLQDKDVKPLVDEDESLQKLKKSKMFRGAQAQRRVSDNQGPALAGEKNRSISWIWYAAEEGDGFSTDQALFEGLRVEWCKAYARVRRWNEEGLLIEEERRRCLETLEWQAKWWEERSAIPQFTGAHAEGVAAYAHYQAHIKRSLLARFEQLWGIIEVPESTTGTDTNSGSGVPDDEEEDEDIAPPEETEIQEIQIYV